jgi:hypothetical protein
MNWALMRTTRAQDEFPNPLKDKSHGIEPIVTDAPL